MKQSWWNLCIIISVLLSACRVDGASVFRSVNLLNSRNANPQPTFKISAHAKKLDENPEVLLPQKEEHVRYSNPPAADRNTEIGGNGFINRSFQGYLSKDGTQTDWKIHVQIAKRFKPELHSKLARGAVLENLSHSPSAVEDVGDVVDISTNPGDKFLGAEVSVVGYGGNTSYDDLWSAWNSVGDFLVAMFDEEAINSNDSVSANENNELTDAKVDEVDVHIAGNRHLSNYTDDFNENYGLYYDSSSHGNDSYDDDLSVLPNITEEEFLPYTNEMLGNEEDDVDIQNKRSSLEFGAINDMPDPSESNETLSSYLNTSRLHERFFFDFFDRGSGSLGRNEDERTSPQRRESRFILGLLGFGATLGTTTVDENEGMGSGISTEAEFEALEEVKDLKRAERRPKFFDGVPSSENELESLDSVVNNTEIEKGRRLWNLFNFGGSGERILSVDDETVSPSLESVTGEFLEKIPEKTSDRNNLADEYQGKQSPDYSRIDESGTEITLMGYSEFVMSESETPYLGSDGLFGRNNVGNESLFSSDSRFEESPLEDLEASGRNVENENAIGSSAFEEGSGESANDSENRTIGGRGSRLVDDYNDCSYDCYPAESTENPEGSYDVELESLGSPENNEIHQNFTFSISENEPKLNETDFEYTTIRYPDSPDPPDALEDKGFVEESTPNTHPTMQFRTLEISSSHSNDGTLTSPAEFHHSELLHVSTKSAEISGVVNTETDINREIDYSSSTAPLSSSTRSRKAKAFDELDPEESENRSKKEEIETTGGPARNPFSLTLPSLRVQTLSTDTVESSITSLTEMTSAVTKDVPLPRACNETWECVASSLNERCVRGETTTICGCGRSFVRHPLTGRCEAKAIVETDLRFPNEAFHEDLHDSSSEFFKETSIRAMDTMTVLIANSKLSATVAEFDVIGFKPGSLIISWILVIPSEGQDTIESLIDEVDKGLRETLNRPSVLRRLSFNFENIELLNVRSSPLEPCLFQELNYCHKNALCINAKTAATGFKCECKDGYADISDGKYYPGEKCEAHCSPDYCGEHGTCRIADNGNVECECSGWFLGEKCKTSGVVLVAGATTAAVLICFLIFLAVVICKLKRHSRYGNTGSNRTEGMDDLRVSGPGSQNVADVLALEERNPLPSRFSYINNTPIVHTLSPSVPKITVTSPSVTVSDTSYEYSDSTFDSVKSPQ